MRKISKEHIKTYTTELAWPQQHVCRRGNKASPSPEISAHASRSLAKLISVHTEVSHISQPRALLLQVSPSHTRTHGNAAAQALEKPDITPSRARAHQTPPLSRAASCYLSLTHTAYFDSAAGALALVASSTRYTSPRKLMSEWLDKDISQVREVE